MKSGEHISAHQQHGIRPLSSPHMTVQQTRPRLASRRTLGKLPTGEWQQWRRNSLLPPVHGLNEGHSLLGQLTLRRVPHRGGPPSAGGGGGGGGAWPAPLHHRAAVRCSGGADPAVWTRGPPCSRSGGPRRQPQTTKTCPGR